jgi:hypothetical protein
MQISKNATFRQFEGDIIKKNGRFIFSQAKKCFLGVRALPLSAPFNAFPRL